MRGMAYEIDGAKVSKPWYIVLTHLRRMGVDFHVNDGRRTLSMQRARVKKHGLWSLSNPTGAAPAVPWAPHINFGRANHAIDADNAAAIEAYLHDHGAPSANRPIAAERWHLQISRKDLLALSRKIARARK